MGQRRSSETHTRYEKPRPVTDAERQWIKELHAQGLGRNEIARRVDRAWSVTSRICREEGLTFDRASVKEANVAMRADMEQMRLKLAYAMLDKAQELIESLDDEFVAFNFGGKDNTFESEVLAGPPPDAIRNIMTSAAIAAQRSMELTKFDADREDTEDTASVFSEVVAGIRKMAAVLDGETPMDTSHAEDLLNEDPA